MNKKMLLALGWFTLLVFTGLGCLFVYLWVNNNIVLHLLGQVPIYFQLLAGLSFGIGTGLFAVFLVNLPPLKETNNYYANLIGSFNLNKIEILFISFCAGVGEEILFRGAFQPLFGLWIVAIVFVAIHGYLNLFDWKISIYGLYMVLVAAGFGYLFSGFGIIAASSAHFAFDVIMLRYLTVNKVE